MSAAELGRRLGISERSVMSLLALLPDTDTVRITRIELGAR